MRNIPLGQILVNMGALTREQLASAIELQKENPGTRLGELLVQNEMITDRQLLEALSKRFMVPLFDMETMPVNTEAVRLLPESTARKHSAVPFDVQNGEFLVATTDPLNFYAMDEIKSVCAMEVEPFLAAESDIEEIIKNAYTETSMKKTLSTIDEEFSMEDEAEEEEEAEEVQQAEERVDNAPVVKLVNTIILKAFQKNASDIHIEPEENATVVRMRIDGDLVEDMRLAKSVHSSLVTRLKILGNMNIAERRIPLDGRFEFDMGDDSKIDIRVSSLPTTNGEKVVMRILGGQKQKIRKIEELGMSEYNRVMFNKLIKCSTGIILVTGPTGSGKTTTLYAALDAIRSPKINIVTVEDPVEMEIPGVNQVHVNAKAGLTFASGLRSILRQDPDVILIGEIRDSETAEIAMRSAITGHLVLSTLHTNDASSAIIRLVNMGIEPYLVGSSVNGIIAQRLVKLNCPHCKKEYMANAEEQKLLGVDHPVPIYRSEGCPECNNTGHKGRTAIHEIILIDPDMRSMIFLGATSQELEEYAVSKGTKLLRQNMSEMVLDGRTSIDELIKTTYSID